MTEKLKVMSHATYWAKQHSGEIVPDPFILCDAIPDGVVVDETDPRFIRDMTRRSLERLANEFLRQCHDLGVTVEGLRIGRDGEHYELLVRSSAREGIARVFGQDPPPRPGCTFPHCHCSNPNEKCDTKR